MQLWTCHCILTATTPLSLDNPIQGELCWLPGQLVLTKDPCYQSNLYSHAYLYTKHFVMRFLLKLWTKDELIQCDTAKAALYLEERVVSMPSMQSQSKGLAIALLCVCNLASLQAVD